MLVRAAQHNLRRRRHLRLNVRRHGHKHRVRKAELHVQPEAVPAVGRAPRVRLERRAVADAHEVQWHGKALGHADDRVGDERAREAPHRALVLLRRVLHRKRNVPLVWGRQGHVRLQGHGRAPQGTSDADMSGRGLDRYRGRDGYGLFADVGREAVYGRRGAEGAQGGPKGLCWPGQHGERRQTRNDRRTRVTLLRSNFRQILPSAVTRPHFLRRHPSEMRFLTRSLRLSPRIFALHPRTMASASAIQKLQSPLKELVLGALPGGAPDFGVSEKDQAEVQAWIEKVAQGEIGKTEGLKVCALMSGMGLFVC